MLVAAVCRRAACGRPVKYTHISSAPSYYTSQKSNRLAGHSFIPTNTITNITTNIINNKLMSTFASKAASTAASAMEHVKDKATNVMTEAKAMMPQMGAKPSSIEQKHTGGAFSVDAAKALQIRGDNVATSNFGHIYPDTTHSLNIGGHILASDSMLMEKQQTFNRNKIVERMVHPCGTGAIGHFEVTKDVSDLTCAAFLDKVGKTTPVFGRFSTTTFGREFPDSARNPRGFAVKFYTEEGNYDMVGLHFPIFFTRDPALGPDVIRSQQRNPENFLLDLDAMFDFMAGVPESLHCGTMMFSDAGTPYGFRHMNAFGCHAFKWVNSEGKEIFVKYHFVSEAGIKNFTWREAQKMCGEDPDFAKRDLYNHLGSGKQAAWRFDVQIMTPDQVDQVDQVDFDPFDVTKVWPHDLFPPREVGRLVFEKNPENYQRDVEQVAFSPGAYVRGIEPSPDPLLQWRSFFYRDAQLYRLGANMHQIPINCPLRAMAVHPIARDGQMRTDANGGNDPQYTPNYRNIPAVSANGNQDRKPVGITGYISRTRAYRGHGATAAQALAGDTPMKGETHEMVDKDPDEEFRQVRQLYLHTMSDVDRQHLHFNIADQLKLCRPEVRNRFLAAISKIDIGYTTGVAKQIETMTNGTMKVDMREVCEMGRHMAGHRPYDGCPRAYTPPSIKPAAAT